MKFRNIKQIPRANYSFTQPWDGLEDWLNRMDEKNRAEGWEGLDLDPDFQRGHVWTEDQKTLYIEYILRGGEASRVILFNHPNWQGSYKGLMVLVDGKQRLEAVRGFLRDEVKVFGGYVFSDFEDRLPFDCSFTIQVTTVKTREAVLQLYLGVNGGVAHTEAELDRVRKLLIEEQSGSEE